MIRSFRSRRLRKLFEEGDGRGLPPDQIARIENRLSTLDAARKPDDMDIAGYGFHRLSGNLKGFYSVKVTGNWRIIFRFEAGDAFDVDHLDYHWEPSLMPMKHPPHPGRIVRDDCLPDLALTVGGAAAALGVSRQTLDKIVNGRSRITPDMAIRFEKVFGSSAETWLRMQLAYDLAEARGREAEIVASIRRPKAA